MSVAPAARFAADPRRRAMLAKVHLAKKELGLDEETYRAVLVRKTGHESAASCSEAQLGGVLDEFKAKGWKPATAGKLKGAKPADHPVAKKARALWISLHQLGEVRDPSERALERFAARQLGVDRLQWADQSQGYRLIEALKAMAGRAGWIQDLAGIDPQLEVRTLKRRLVLRLQEKLGVALFSSADLARAPESRLDELAVEFARQLRERQA